MGLIIGGVDIKVPGLVVQSFRDDPKLSLAPGDYRKRPTQWVRGIVLHTTKGIPGGKDKRPQLIKPGIGPNSEADEKVAKMWSLDARNAGAHLVADSDGSFVCTCDLLLHASFHAGNVNNVTIGLEIYQGSDASIYEGQLKSVLFMVDFLTKHFGIQRQYHKPYKRHAIKRGLNKGLDIVGVYGHRDCSNNRGPGDPGDAIFEVLDDAGYEAFDFEENEDKHVWSERQDQLGILDDGVPGRTTVDALRAAGHKHGLWVSRDGD